MREPCVLFQWVVEPQETHVAMLIEQLRYAGIVSIVKEDTVDGMDTTYMLELRAPKGVDARVWADQNARRMQSFGINAEASWKEKL